jgi:cytochrome c oxidase subunit 2
MTGRIVVMQIEDYAQWLAAQPQGDGLSKEGETIFRARGCSGCHSQISKVHAPSLDGVFGRKVPLADGRTVDADEAYLRDSMLKPRQDVAAGYEPIMPSYAGILTDGEIVSLTAYIRSLSQKEENR